MKTQPPLVFSNRTPNKVHREGSAGTPAPPPPTAKESHPHGVGRKQSNPRAKPKRTFFQGQSQVNQGASTAPSAARPEGVGGPTTSPSSSSPSPKSKPLHSLLTPRDLPFLHHKKTTTVSFDLSPSSSQSHQPHPTLPGRGRGWDLDLFSGTGSVGQRLKVLGYDVISVDLDPRTNTTFHEDVMEWEYRQFSPGYFRVVAASVPCAEYSLAKTTAPRNFERADNLVQRVL